MIGVIRGIPVLYASSLELLETEPPGIHKTHLLYASDPPRNLSGSNTLSKRRSDQCLSECSQPTRQIKGDIPPDDHVYPGMEIRELHDRSQN